VWHPAECVKEESESLLRVVKGKTEFSVHVSHHPMGGYPYPKVGFLAAVVVDISAAAVILASAVLDVAEILAVAAAAHMQSRYSYPHSHPSSLLWLDEVAIEPNSQVAAKRVQVRQ
jgi:hypothetical protein